MTAEMMVCPLCGSSPTNFHESHSDGDEVVKLGFNHQKCKNDACGLPCKLWGVVRERIAAYEQAKGVT